MTIKIVADAKAQRNKRRMTGLYSRRPDLLSAENQRSLDAKVKQAKEMASVETALVKGADSYHWRTYTGSKPMSLTSKHGIKVKLEMGDRFGKRMSADGKKIRAIFEELGPTKVFTIDLATSVKLDKNSKQVKAR